MLAVWNKNKVCFDAAKTPALYNNSEHRSRIMQSQFGMPTVTGLHVNEGEGTETVGNNMSLYEQLTVSSHRFAQLSDPCRTSATSSYADHSFTCPFFGTIEGTAVRENKSNDAARWQAVAASDVLLKSIAVATMKEKLDGTTREGSAECLGSLPPNKSNDNKKEFTQIVTGQDSPCADLMLLVKGAQCLSIGNSLHRAALCKEEVLSPQFEARTGCDIETIVPLFNSQALGQIELHGEQDAENMEISGVGHISQAQDQVMLLDGPISAQLKGEGCIATKEIVQDVKLCGASASASASASIQESDSICCKEPVFPGHDAKVSRTAQEVVILDVPVGYGTANCSVGMECKICEDSVIEGSCKCKVAGISLMDIQIRDDTCDPEAGCAIPISPKSVIQAVGQLRFWKARLALIRQQRIFADQLFELHKLIEVQRLIAGTPNVPINEIYFGIGNMIMDCDSDGSPAGLINIEEVNAEAVGKEVSVFKEVGKAPSIVTEKNCGESKCPSNAFHAENVVSARRCSSLAVVPWPTPEPAQTGICQNPSFAQSFAPGPAVCGPFVAALQEHEAATTGSPLFAFPLPQSTTSVQSSYGFAVASTHQQESVPNHNRSPGCKVANLSGQRTPNKKHCAREGPTMTVASINHQPDMSLRQLRTKCSSSTNSKPQRYGKEGHSPRKTLEVLGLQADNLQHASMGSELNTPMARLLNDRHQGPKTNELDSMQATDMQQEYKIKKIGSFRGWKRQQDQPVNVVKVREVGGCTSSNPSLGALNLFPLAPTLTSHCDSRGPSSGGKEWQGHVIKVVPRPAESASESAAGILLSIQQERKP
ncbi:hypothetical protein L7F22_053613 [Adiantum nelumboides]|nr:hypothetical protein [Adiantum nelumboides]